MQEYRYVILGGGVAAGYAAQELASLGLRAGELCIVSNDNTLPYERPPLSKDFLAGTMAAEAILINDEDFYRQHGIDVRLNTEIIIVDLANRRLRSAGREEIGFEKLVIATGSRPRTLDLPGADERGIIYLRSLEDAQGIQAQAQAGQRAIVIGGGYIGMEVSAVLNQRGVETTMVFHGDRFMHTFFTPEMSAFFENYYLKQGVHLQKSTEPVAFTYDSRASGVQLRHGQTLTADLIVAGIGVVPNTELFDGTGLQIDQGIVVNEYLETNMPNVYAAGDITRYRDQIFDRQRHIEHWDNAMEQGRHVARVLTNRREPFVKVPYFFSDVFDLSWEFWGDIEEANHVVQRGDVSSGSFSTWWLRNGRLVAAFIMDRPEDEREMAPEWIRTGQKVPLELLEDADLVLNEPYPDTGAPRRRG